jgi:hypothetical protein
MNGSMEINYTIKLQSQDLGSSRTYLDLSVIKIIKFGVLLDVTEDIFTITKEVASLLNKTSYRGHIICFV